MKFGKPVQSKAGRRVSTCVCSYVSERVEKKNLDLTRSEEEGSVYFIGGTDSESQWACVGHRFVLTFTE